MISPEPGAATPARRARRIAHVAANYVRGTASLADLGRLLRVRLSLTPAGPLLAPRSGEAVVNLRGVGPIVVRNRTSDVFVVSELLDGDSYDGLALHAPGDVRLVLDLGANTGIVTRWLLAHFPEARVIAVEPDPATCAALRRNLAGQERATVVEAGVGSASGRATMAGDSGAIGRRVEPAQAGSIEVLTVPDLLARAGVDAAAPIDVLKCDVEGAERDLFADCRTWIGRVRTLAVETHDGYTIAGVAADLAAAGVQFEIREHVVHAEFGNEVGVLALRDDGAPRYQ
jgi:FkbM family methyltransferase